uniref:Uncharacterized protein n=1 Tax=Ciona intestinalis TaxID=7719 RepID=H2XXC1_CIOIN
MSVNVQMESLLHKQHKELVKRHTVLEEEMSRICENDRSLEKVPDSSTAHERNIEIWRRCTNAYSQINKNKAFIELSNHKSLKEKYEKMVRSQQTKKPV